MPRARARLAPLPRLLAILAADAVGYSRLMAADAGDTLALLDAARAAFRAEVERRGGRIVDTAGDSVLAAFDSAAAAVTAAIAAQRRLAVPPADTADGAPAAALPFRIGVHLGDVIVKEDGSVYGDGVNVAARLQALADAGGIVVSQAVHAIVAQRSRAPFADLGEQALKNIAPPIRAYRLLRAETADVWRFGRFELQPRACRLLADGHDARLAVPAVDVLIALVERAGEVVARSDLIERAWPGAVVADAELGAQIAALRRVLGGAAIVTLPGRGYRFTPQPQGAGIAAGPAPPPGAASGHAEVKLKTNLPASLTPLIGRDDDLAALEALVGRHRLVSIVGAGGIGKSLLAQHLLRRLGPRYRHGVCFVELGTSASAAEVAGVVAAALGVELVGDDAIMGLARAVAPLQLLLALDNAEHVLEGVAALAAALDQSAPDAQVVTTSQAPLRLPAERVHRLGALAVPGAALPAHEALAFGAVALFAERARAADSRFEITEAQIADVVRLCRALDGHPLALELAAARAPTLGLRQLADAMPQRLKVLTRSANRLAPARQRTLRATLEWSHGLLDEGERIVFRRLAVFAGSADLALIQQVAAGGASDSADTLDEWAVLDALDVLVERSLAVALAPATGQPRYRLLDTPREFAVEQLAAAGEAAALRERHAVAVGARFAAAHDERFVGGVGIGEWESKLQPDLDNARDALAWAQAASRPPLALAIAPAAWWATVSTNSVGATALAEACEAIARQAPDDAGAARAMLAAAQHWSDARPERTAALAQWAIERERLRHEAGGDARWLYLALCRSALALAHSSPAAAREPLQEARALEQAAWAPVVRAERCAAEARWAAATGDTAMSLCASEEQLRLIRAAGYASHVATSGYADALLHVGDIDGAVRAGEALVAQMDGTRFAYSLGYARLNLAAAYLARDDAAAARGVCAAGWPDAVRFEMNAWWADYLALLAALEGRAGDAAQLAGYADAAYRRQQDRRQPNEGAAVERARMLARRALGDAAVQRLEAQGARLADADVGAIALALPGADESVRR